MRLTRAAIGALGVLAFTVAFADEAPKPAKGADKPDCRDLPIPGSHIKAHVCDDVDHYRYLRSRDGLLSLSAPSATTSLPPVSQTTTPIQ
jgi:hypothetical protein